MFVILTKTLEKTHSTLLLNLEIKPYILVLNELMVEDGIKNQFVECLEKTFLQIFNTFFKVLENVGSS